MLEKIATIFITECDVYLQQVQENLALRKSGYSTNTIPFLYVNYQKLGYISYVCVCLEFCISFLVLSKYLVKGFLGVEEIAFILRNSEEGGRVDLSNLPIRGDSDSVPTFTFSSRHEELWSSYYFCLSRFSFAIWPHWYIRLWVAWIQRTTKYTLTRKKIGGKK